MSCPSGLRLQPLGRIEEGVQPVRHAEGADVAGDELALEAELALERRSLRARRERARSTPFVHHVDLLAGMPLAHQVRLNECVTLTIRAARR